MALVARYRPIAAPAGLLVCVIFDIWLLSGTAMGWHPGFDLYASWAVNLNDPWHGAGTSMLGLGIFRWTPVAAQAASVLHVLPWPAMLSVFLMLQLVTIVLMAGRRWPYVVLLPPVFFNLWIMNVDLFIGAAVVAGFRWPGAWAFVFLTKITPGVGALWFAFRREWRSFAIAIGFTAALVVGSFLLAPNLWEQWVVAMREMAAAPQQSFLPSVYMRIPLAVVVVWYAARTDRRWLVPVACLVAVPNVWFVTGAVLGASIALWPSPRSRLGAIVDRSPLHMLASQLLAVPRRLTVGVTADVDPADGPPGSAGS